MFKIFEIILDDSIGEIEISNAIYTQHHIVKIRCYLNRTHFSLGADRNRVLFTHHE
jgi:hypothetical protein